MGNSWTPQFDSDSISPSSAGPSSPEIAQNTSNEGMHSGTGSAFSTRLDEDFPNGQILTTPSFTFTFAELATAFRNFRRERGMGDSRIPHFDSSSTSPSPNRPSSPGVISATIEADKNQLTVVGEELDSVNWTTLLRKRMSSKIERLFCIGIVSSELQKVVLEVDMHDAKSRSKAMEITARVRGVISATIETDKNQLIVVGEGLDSVNLTTLLRKRMSSKRERLFCISIVSSELVSVTPVDEKIQTRLCEESSTVFLRLGLRKLISCVIIKEDGVCR